MSEYRMISVELIERTICRLTHGHERDKVVGELRALLSEQPQAGALTIKDCLTVAAQSAPAGEREAYEQWKADMQSYGFNGADAFQAGAAWQRTQAAGVPDGWCLVPIKPTIEMVEAGYEEGIGKPDRSGHARVIEQYDAMLAAAPAQGQQVEWRTTAVMLEQANAGLAQLNGKLRAELSALKAQQVGQKPVAEFEPDSVIKKINF